MPPWPNPRLVAPCRFTVYDFLDLRSALKLWLEEYGYDVLMSEFDDCTQVPDL